MLPIYGVRRLVHFERMLFVRERMLLYLYLYFNATYAVGKTETVATFRCNFCTAIFHLCCICVFIYYLCCICVFIYVAYAFLFMLHMRFYLCCICVFHLCCIFYLCCKAGWRNDHNSTKQPRNVARMFDCLK